jgi:hypothetical protein
MTDTPTLANSGAPASPAPSPPPASTAPPGPGPRPSAPPNPRSTGYSPARDRYEQIQGHAHDQAGEAPPGDQPAPPAADAGKIKIGKFEVSETELASMLQRQSAEDLRKATLPPSPQDYKLSLPENLTLPGNGQYRFDEAGNKASFDAVKAWAHSRGLSQSDFSNLMGLYASHHAAQDAMLAARAREELAKVGPNSAMRLDAITRWVRGEVGDADAGPIMAATVTDAQLRFLERMQEKLTSQGVGSFSQSHRAAPDDQGIPGYEKMSFEQRRFAQDQIAARTRR